MVIEFSLSHGGQMRRVLRGEKEVWIIGWKKEWAKLSRKSGRVKQKHISILNFEGLSSLQIKPGNTDTLLGWSRSIWCKEMWKLLQKVYEESCFYPNINKVTSFIALICSHSFPIYNTQPYFSKSHTFKISGPRLFSKTIVGHFSQVC